ncbi:unnamed protein product [Adineta ricciae]|uniref:Uncharacterized protein n=1 Tax=Adineta ricciae TaxID=249248 RepID=A0A813MQL2_ADIRI|nr:unnamed protein product [Adineta ricciae]
MDTSQYIRSCNPARFVITGSLLIFSILFASRLDGYIQISYWLVFLPLFIWKMLVIFGACTGVFIWCKSGEQNRILRSPDNDCRALIIYFFMHILLFTFEILTCDKLENGLEIQWILCFTPLLLCTVVSFISCLWLLKTQRNFLIPTFITINGLFFLFFPLRLDYFSVWRYSIVFIPVWISLCIAIIFVFIKIILALVHRCSRRIVTNQREITTITEAILYALMFIPLGIFAILLVERLDKEEDQQLSKLSYSIIVIPLYISLIAWMMFSFGASDGNPWWFGLRRDLCEILLGRCPVISLYFNNQYKFDTRTSMNDVIIDLTTSTNEKNIESIHKSKLTVVTKEKNLVTQHQSASLLEPD